MKKVITVNEMRECDFKTIEAGTSGKELMYRAAFGIYNSYSWDGIIGIFCGSGNNAGDLAANDFGFTPLLSSDTANYIGKTFKMLLI